MCVLYDPSGVYTGSKFLRGEFAQTLKDGFWPPSMYVMQEDTRQVYIVRGNENVPWSAPEKAFKPQQILPISYGADEIPHRRAHVIARAYG